MREVLEWGRAGGKAVVGGAGAGVVLAMAIAKAWAVTTVMVRAGDRLTMWAAAIVTTKRQNKTINKTTNDKTKRQNKTTKQNDKTKRQSKTTTCPKEHTQYAHMCLECRETMHGAHAECTDVDSPHKQPHTDVKFYRG